MEKRMEKSTDIFSVGYGIIRVKTFSADSTCPQPAGQAPHPVFF